MTPLTGTKQCGSEQKNKKIKQQDIGGDDVFSFNAQLGNVSGHNLIT